MSLRYVDWFCGAGGSTQGVARIPGVRPVLAANHDPLAIDSHSANFPQVEHFRGDIRDLDVSGHPYAELYWASPECTNWTPAKGQPQDFTHPDEDLFGHRDVPEEVERSRALMEDVIRYLRGMHLRQRPVLAGVVENVVDVRKWVAWDRWRSEIEVLGYRTRLIAFNSMHAAPRRTPRAPQSRDRLYLAYWHRSLGRDPDWDRYLQPDCWCNSCEQIVSGIQTWKKPGQDMGRYNAQYYYRCPHVACRGRRAEPFYLPAREALDWTIPGQRIGDRTRPLSEKTMARIVAALVKWGPAIVEAGGNQYDSHDPRHPQYGQLGAYSRSWPLTEPLRTLQASTTKGLLVPTEGRSGKRASSVESPLRTQTARNDLALLTMLRGQNVAKPVDGPMDTFAASGNHHGLLVPSGGTWHTEPYATTDPMRTVLARENHGVLVPYYGTGAVGTSTDLPVGTLTSRDRYALIMRNNTARGNPAQMSTPVDQYLRTITGAGHQSLLEPPTIDPYDCLFRMLEPHEIGAGMAFLPDYIVLGSKRDRVRQYGLAVTPPVAEVLMSALVECIQGHDIDWERAA